MPICFASCNQGNGAAPVIPIQLNARHGDALAALLPVLICGEESASLAFAQLTRAPALSMQAHRQLAGIERDEARHERLLLQLRASLPQPPVDAALLRALRRFFLRLREADIGRHFARIAALDSAVCTLLGSLRSRNSPLASAPILANLFARIHRDEVQHVLVARSHAGSLIGAAKAHTIAIDTRHQLVELLLHRADALEQILGVDPDRLFARLRQPPRALFA
jgi:hypothetical protein